MITGIPDYTGAGRMIGDAESRARERAGQMNAQFIDARETPFYEL
jgi:hypothetical protein